MKKIIIGISLLILLASCNQAETNNISTNGSASGDVAEKSLENESLELPFDLEITGKNINTTKSLSLSHVDGDKTKINFDFEGKNGEQYNFDLQYKKLASNRSYPTNLDITIKDSDGEKLGYLFWATNGIDFLKKMGTFGLIIDIEGEPVDVKFNFDKNISGDLRVKDLGEERFVQDTLVSKFNFQMIRPVIVPQVSEGLRSVTYSLDNHPYSINYTIKDTENGGVEFQHNLYSTSNDDEKLLERIYFQAGSLEVLREAMYAGKYFDKENGAFKLVFYPAMGQLEPNK